VINAQLWGGPGDGLIVGMQDFSDLIYPWTSGLIPDMVVHKGRYAPNLDTLCACGNHCRYDWKGETSR